MTTLATPAIDALDAALDDQEAALVAAADAAFALARRSPTIANRNAYKKQERELKEFRRHRHEVTATDAPLRTISAVLDWLDNENWKISKTKLYDDHNAGRLQAREDGTFLASTVLDYALLHLDKKDGTPGRAAAGPSFQEQKIKEEIGRIRADRLNRELKYQESSGDLIKKSDVESELAKRAAYLRSDLKNIFRASAIEIIKRVGGDPQRAPEIISFGTRLVDESLDRYSRPVKGFDDE